jgi:drug/metabolite transporter (DMT)-like permease
MTDASTSKTPATARDTGLPGVSRRTLAVLAIAATVVMWGSSSVAIKAVSTSGLVTVFYRLWFAIPPLWLTVALAPRMRRRLDRPWLEACVAGGVLFALHQLLFFTSLKLTTVVNVTLIGALQPGLVLLAAGRLFGERATARAVAWFAVALGGTALVVLGSTGVPGWSPAGDLLAAANLFAFTAYFLLSKRIRARLGAWEYVVGMTTVSGLVIGAVALATGQDLGSPGSWEWLVLVFLAVFPGTLGHVLTNWAHPHVAAFTASVMLLAVPVIAAAGAHAVLGETLGAAQIAGGIVVLVAIGVVVRSARGVPREELAESAAETGAP